MQQIFIQRFQETQVVMCDATSQLFFCRSNGCCSFIPYRANRNYRQVITVFQLTSLPYFYSLQRTLPISQYTPSTRITDGKRSFIRQLGRVHQLSQLMFIVRRSNCQIRYRSQISHIKSPMMRRSVFTHQSGAVQTKYHIQLLNGYIMNYIIVCTLHKRRIHITERQKPVFRHSSRESHGMSFRNSYVKHTVGHFLHHNIHGTSGRHGGSYPHDFLILTG